MHKLNIILLLTLCAWHGIAQNLPAPYGLSVDYLRAPDEAVITNSIPKLAWIFPKSGIKQSAYQIMVASSPFLLGQGKADLWDSGKISSDNSVNIQYAGKPLKDRSIYWWQVKVWSQEGLESTYSEAQQFNTGTFDPTKLDYPGQSRWIEIVSDHWVSEDKQCASFHRSAPVSITENNKKSLFVDFGMSAIGILEFTATSDQDDLPITIHLGERKYEDNTVHKEPGRSNIGYDKVEMLLKKGMHHYVVKISEREIKGYLHSQKLAPHYPEVMPFRYAEIFGNLSKCRIDELQQGGLFYYFDEEASDFTSSNENLNAVWNLCKYTQKATPFLGVYADGNRERMPYEADAYIQQMSHFATDREYSISRYTINFLLDHASWPTEWQMHMVMMAWEYYMQTGDVDLLNNRYEDLKQKSLIALSDESGLISTRTGKKTQEFLKSINFPGKPEQFRDNVDWPHGAPKGKNGGSHRSPLEGGETDGYVFTDYNTVVNAFHNRCLVLMTLIAEIVGTKNDQSFFANRAKEHHKIFMATFFDQQKGIFVDGELTEHSSLHANMFPMAFNMVPEKHVQTVATFIKSRWMACSVYGSQYLLEALFKAGEPEHALDLMTSEDKRSWMNMIRVGSSMTTEAWDEYYKPNLTWNHAWGSAPANIVARKLMGIEPIEPTFSKFRISPQPGYLEHLKIKVPTIRGAVEVNMKLAENRWEMEISVPGNAEAELWIPEEFSIVTINGLEQSSSGLIGFSFGKRNVYELKSGHYSVVALQ